MSQFDPAQAFRTFADHGVRYLVVGGLAGEILGAPIATNDLDICYERTPDNMERLAAALVSLGAKLRVANVEDDLPFILDARSLAAGDCFTFRSEVGDIDVLVTPSGTAGYSDLVQRATAYDLGSGLVVNVVSLDDLIRMKEAAGRAKDRAHLEVLAALKEMVDDTE